jgi:pseudouridine-5'-monophosphatase
MDGLVLDTESIYTKVQDTIAGEVGKTFGWDLKAKIMGMKGVDACQCIVRDTS